MEIVDYISNLLKIAPTFEFREKLTQDIIEELTCLYQASSKFNSNLSSRLLGRVIQGLKGKLRKDLEIGDSLVKILKKLDKEKRLKNE